MNGGIRIGAYKIHERAQDRLNSGHNISFFLYLKVKHPPCVFSYRYISFSKES